MAADPPKKLTANQRRFCLEFGYDRNAVQAYIRAFGEYTSNGNRRSYKAAADSAQKLLENPGIAAEILAAERAYAKRCGYSNRKVLREIAAVAFADAADVCETDKTGATVAKTIGKIPVATRKAIQSVKVKRRRIAGAADEVYEVEEVEYKLADKLVALEKLARRLGLLQPDQPGTKSSADTAPRLVHEIIPNAAPGP